MNTFLLNGQIDNITNQNSEFYLAQEVSEKNSKKFKTLHIQEREKK